MHARHYGDDISFWPTMMLTFTPYARNAARRHAGRARRAGRGTIQVTGADRLYSTPDAAEFRFRQPSPHAQPPSVVFDFRHSLFGDMHADGPAILPRQRRGMRRLFDASWPTSAA